MRKGIEIQSDRVTVPPLSFSHKRTHGSVEIPKSMFATLDSYGVRNLADAMEALYHIKHHPHYWTTAGEILSLEITEPIVIMWHEMDYDYNNWESMYVASASLNQDGGILFSEDVDVMKAAYLSPESEYRENYLQYSEQDWIELARSENIFYDASPILVIEPHPVLFNI